MANAQMALMLFSVSTDGTLVVRKAIFHLRRRDTQAWFCLQRVTRHLFASIVTSIWNISSLHGSFRVRGACGSYRVRGPRGSFRVGVRVRFSVSVGVSVVDGK